MANNSNEKVTLKDIAREVGVSATTVSRVINNSQNVHEYTRQKVKKAIKKFGYSPNPIATALKTGKSNSVQIFIETFNNPFVNQIISGIDENARERQINIIINRINYQRDLEENHSRLLESYVKGAIFVFSFSSKPRLEKVMGSILKENNLPAVCVYSYSDYDKYPSILPDDYQGGYLAVEHLAVRGYQKIAYINGLTHWSSAEQRFKGYQQALKDLNLTEDADLIAAGDWSVESGYQACLEILNRTRPDAIFTANDEMAVGVMDALLDKGLKVPGDVGVIGFDNNDFCDFIRPSLTSIGMPLREMGKKAINLLHTYIREETIPEAAIKKVKCYVKARNST